MFWLYSVYNRRRCFNFRCEYTRHSDFCQTPQWRRGLCNGIKTESTWEQKTQLNFRYTVHTLLLIHTLFLKHFYVPDDSPEEGSFLGVIIHAAGHQFSQLPAVWSGQLTFGFIKPLLLLKIKKWRTELLISEVERVGSSRRRTRKKESNFK